MQNQFQTQNHFFQKITLEQKKKALVILKLLPQFRTFVYLRETQRKGQT